MKYFWFEIWVKTKFNDKKYYVQHLQLMGLQDDKEND